MGKVVKVGGRGTSRRVTDDEKENWSGESFKEYQRKQKEAAGNEYV